MKNRRTEIVMSIPGGWYGNDPGSLTEPSRGNVVVDVARVCEALTFLRRRGARILQTSISDDPNPGIFVLYELAGRKSPTYAGI